MASFFIIENGTTSDEIRRAIQMAEPGDIVQVSEILHKQAVEQAIKEAHKSQNGIRVVMKSGKQPFE